MDNSEHNKWDTEDMVNDKLILSKKVKCFSRIYYFLCLAYIHVNEELIFDHDYLVNHANKENDTIQIEENECIAKNWKELW